MSNRETLWPNFGINHPYIMVGTFRVRHTSKVNPTTPHPLPTQCQVPKYHSLSFFANIRLWFRRGSRLWSVNDAITPTFSRHSGGCSVWRCDCARRPGVLMTPGSRATLHTDPGGPVSIGLRARCARKAVPTDRGFGSSRSRPPPLCIVRG